MSGNTASIVQQLICITFTQQAKTLHTHHSIISTLLQEGRSAMQGRRVVGGKDAFVKHAAALSDLAGSWVKAIPQSILISACHTDTKSMS